MTDEQPLALKLADAISRIDTLTEYQRKLIFQAAAELRRMHDENAELRAANEAFDKRQKWWNEKMFVLENVAPESLFKLTKLRRLNAESDDEVDRLKSIEAAALTVTYWQRRCLAEGFKYWRAPDAHGVTCTKEQAENMLAAVLGVEVEIGA
jgi:hypothetical protein